MGIVDVVPSVLVGDEVGVCKFLEFFAGDSKLRACFVEGGVRFDVDDGGVVLDEVGFDLVRRPSLVCVFLAHFHDLLVEAGLVHLWEGRSAVCPGRHGILVFANALVLLG